MELSRPLLTITPTIDGDVLAVLAKSDVAFTTSELHRLLPRTSVGGIRKVLQRLSEQGVVLTRTVGRTFSYQLNRDHLAAEYIIGLAKLPDTLLRRIEDRLVQWMPAPVYAAVFGSAALGSMTTDSDLDVLLVRPDDIDDATWGVQVNELAAEVTRWIGNDTRPLVFTAAELAERGGDEPVLRDVLANGLTVLGTRSWLAEQLRRRSD